MTALTTPTKGTRLTRADLKGFDTTATTLVLDAMARGGTGIVSNRGHVLLYAPGGRSCSISRKLSSNNRARQNTEAEWARVFGDLPLLEEAGGPEKAPPVLPSPALALAESPRLPCPLPECESVFVTEGARYAHCHTIHHVCPEPGCQHVSKNKTGSMSHQRIVHQGERPAKGTSRAQKAASTIQQIRELVGATDPKEVAQLRQELAAMTKRAEAAEKRLAKLKEALA